MKQFQNDLKAKAHLRKIQNAKTTISNPKFRATQIKQDEQEKITLLLKQYDSNDFKTIPVYKLLKHYNLQQYTRQMIQRGYGVNISKLSYLTDNDRNKMFQDIKILPGHTLKFLKMIEQISKNLENTDNNFSIQSNSLPSEITSKYSNSNIEKPFMKQLDQKDDYQQQLEQILNQYTPEQPKKKNVTKSNIPIPVTSVVQNFKKQKQDIKSYRNSKNSIPSISSKIVESSKKPIESTKKTIVINNQNAKKLISSKPTIKSNIKQNAKSSLPNKKILPSLKGLSTQKKKEKIEIDLNLDKIKTLYASVDGGVMTSTIVNIDLEQSCYCIASYLQKNISVAPRKNAQQKSSTASQSQNVMQAQGNTQDDVSQILRQSYLHPLYKENNNQQNIQIDQQINKSYQQQDQAENNDDAPKLGESSFLGNNSSVCFGVHNALDIFQQPNPSEVDYYIPTIDSLSNFIKNIVLSAKMQRQVPILSILYVQKFIKNAGIQFHSLNYKRILVSCLLLASKVWDDESFETPSFSHTFPDYTTVLLNQLEKQILVAINYELKLDKKQYALLYYKLRQFRSAKTKSYQNRALNILRVRQLQKGIKKQYRRDYLTKRKSF